MSKNFYIILLFHISLAFYCPSNKNISNLLQNVILKAKFANIFDISINNTAHALVNVDISLVSFANGCNPSYGNVLFSRDFPTGKIVDFKEGSLSVEGIDYRWWDYNRWDSFDPDDWTKPPDGEWFGQLVPGQKGNVFLSPHPASSFKLMVAFGLMYGVQNKILSLDEDASLNITVYPDSSPTSRFIFSGSLDDALKAMLSVSDNSATASCTAALHRGKILPDLLPKMFKSIGLDTLAYEGTQYAGHWGGTYEHRNRSSDYDTTGFFRMTSWDGIRLLWVIDPDTPDPIWRVNDKPIPDILSKESKIYLKNILLDQLWSDWLSTVAICGRTGRLPGIPSFETKKWITSDGKVKYKDNILSEDVRPCQNIAEVEMAHKTGHTVTFGSNFASIKSKFDESRRYIIGIMGNLGERFADKELVAISPSHNPCKDFHVCTTQKAASIGYQIDFALKNLNE